MNGEIKDNFYFKYFIVHALLKVRNKYSLLFLLQMIGVEIQDTLEYGSSCLLKNCF